MLYGYRSDQPRVLVAVSLVSRKGWTLGAGEVAAQPPTYPEVGTGERSAYLRHDECQHYRRQGFYFSGFRQQQDTDVEAWAVEYKFHVVRRRMVFSDPCNRRDFDGFAPIWVDEVRRALVVDTAALAELYTDVEMPHRFSADIRKVCNFFAQACVDTDPRMESFFAELVARTPVRFLTDNPAASGTGNDRSCQGSSGAVASPYADSPLNEEWMSVLMSLHNDSPLLQDVSDDVQVYEPFTIELPD
jgi:hypothetical protein